ncbi:NAD(P)H-dependent oxidoreductase [Taklimakanibacter lacteus]|uniref:NAD(P)H-dependent oxidoreductase n=1 Tax=Taklimakanibacter lacteus TaxID=2268456 RepID=UPI0034D6BD08
MPASVGILYLASFMKILILFAHPRLSGSHVQRTLSDAVSSLSGVTFHDLYAAYPDFTIDVAREQALLAEHDVIVLQHPFYWYSAPAIIKEWLDLVLELGWAYGPGGDKLHRKFLMNAISTGGADAAYRRHGRNRFEITDLLSPFNQSAHLCGMAYLEPFVVFAGRWLTAEDLALKASDYQGLIEGLRDGHIDPMTRLAKAYALPLAFEAQRLQKKRHAT